MTTGRRPYPGNSLYQLIESVANNRPIPRPNTLRLDLPKACDDAIMDGLVHDREKRIQTAKELVTRFAAGVPNGDAMLAYVAPRLVRSALAPTAKTISAAIGPAAMQWRAAAAASTRAAELSRKTRWVAMVAAVIACLSIGVIVERLRRGPAAAATVARTFDAPNIATLPPPASHPVPSLDAPVAITASAPPIDAPPVVAKIAVDAAAVPLVVNAPIDSRPAVAVVTVVDAAPLNVPPTLPVAVATKGTLVVRVDPFADVVIDGVLVGAAPVKRQLSVGDHTVKLTGPNDRTETIRVRILAGKSQSISRTWQE